MKQKTLLLLMTFFTLMLVGCQEKATSRKSSDQNALNCTGSNYYNVQGCAGYIGNNNNVSCSGQAYWTTPGCAGFCQYNPTSTACGGSTGGTTTGTTTGGGTTGTTANCSTNPYSYQCYCQTYPQATGCPSGVNAISPYWGVKYPPNDVPPDNTASSCGTYLPSGMTSAHETRKGTVTVVGGAWYNPASGATLYNTSSTLKTLANAKKFYITDSMLKVRFKVRPQPYVGSGDSSACFGRTATGSIAGYYKLLFNVKLVGTRADNTLGEEDLGTIAGNLNTCTPSIDLSNYVGMYPKGVYLIISNVQSNQLYWPNDYSMYGFKNATAMRVVRAGECWTMDLEVAADGTKTFD